MNDYFEKDLTVDLIERELRKEPLMLNEIIEKTKSDRDTIRTRIKYLIKEQRVKKAGPKGTGNVQYYYVKGIDYGLYKSLTTGKCNTKHAKRILKEVSKGPLWVPSISKKKFIYHAADRMVDEGVLEKVETNVSGTKTVLYAFPDQTIKELGKSINKIEKSIDISNDKESLRIKKEIEKIPLTVADLVNIIGHDPEFVKRRLNHLISKGIIGKAGRSGKTFVQYYYIKDVDYGLYQPLITGKCNTDYSKELLEATSKGPIWLPSLNHKKYACIRNGAERMVGQGVLKRTETIIDGNKRVYYDLAEPFKSAQIKRNLEERIKWYEQKQEPFTLEEITNGFSKEIVHSVIREKLEVNDLKKIKWGDKEFYLPKIAKYFYINKKIQEMQIDFEPEWKIKAYYLFVNNDRNEIAKEFNQSMSSINSAIPKEYDDLSLYLLNSNFDPNIKWEVRNIIGYRDVSFSDYESVNRPLHGDFLTMACSAELKLIKILSSIPGVKSRIITQENLIYPKEQFNNLLLNKFDLVVSSMNVMNDYCLNY
jgi:hypothetical protein